MHRLFASSAILLALAVGSAAVAQEADASQTFPDTMGLPELRITATDAGFADVPAETAAVNLHATGPFAKVKRLHPYDLGAT